MIVKYIAKRDRDGKTFEIQLPSGTIIAQGGDCLALYGGEKRLIFPSGNTIEYWQEFFVVELFDKFSVEKTKEFIRPKCTKDLTDSDYKLLIEFLYEKVKQEFYRTQKIKGNNMIAKYSRYPIKEIATSGNPR